VTITVLLRSSVLQFSLFGCCVTVPPLCFVVLPHVFRTATDVFVCISFSDRRLRAVQRALSLSLQTATQRLESEAAGFNSNTGDADRDGDGEGFDDEQQTKAAIAHIQQQAAAPPKMLVKVRHADGKEMKFRVFATDAVQVVIDGVCQMAGLVAEDVCVVFDGERLDPGRTFKDYDMEDQDLLELRVKK